MGLEIHVVGFKLQLANSAVASRANTHLNQQTQTATQTSMLTIYLRQNHDFSNSRDLGSNVKRNKTTEAAS